MRRVVFSLVIVSLMGCTEGERSASYQVDKVVDGDTLMLRSPDGTVQKVDLANVDAPEREQPFGVEARQSLLEMTAGKPLTLTWVKARAVIAVDGVEVNRQLVQSGHAWARRDNSDPIALAAMVELETHARIRFKGLWGQEHALIVAPWQWRAQAREPSRNRPLPVAKRPENRPVKINKRPVNPAYQQTDTKKGTQ